MRLKNLLNLIASEPFNGNKAAFARAINKPAPNIHRLTNKKCADNRDIGEDFAREMEAALGLPLLWFDLDHSNEADQSHSKMLLNESNLKDPKTAYQAKDKKLSTLTSIWVKLTEQDKQALIDDAQRRADYNMEIVRQLKNIHLSE